MKKQLLAFGIAALGFQVGFAQQLLKTYYDYRKTKVHEEYYADGYGVKSGAYKEYSEFGGILVQGTYKNDVKIGKWITNNSDGTPSIIENFNDKGERHGSFITWLNGHKIFEGTYQNGKKEGNCKEWDASVNQLIKDQNFKNGMLSGKATTFYSNGKKQSEGVYENDMATGKFIFYYQSGSIESEGAFVNGAKNGEWKFYDENGKIFKQGNLTNNTDDGEWLYYDESANGEVLTKGIFKNGQMFGEWKKYYDSKWNLTFNKSLASYYRIVTYDEQGKGKATDFYITGEKQWEGYVINNEDYQDGTCTSYYKNGNKKEEGAMKSEYDTHNRQWKSYQTGIWNTWYESGKIKGSQIEYESDGTYRSNIRNGKYYDESGELIKIIDNYYAYEGGRMKQMLEEQKEKDNKNQIQKLKDQIYPLNNKLVDLLFDKVPSSTSTNYVYVPKNKSHKWLCIKAMGELHDDLFSKFNNDGAFQKRIEAGNDLLKLLQICEKLAATDNEEMEKQLKKAADLAAVRQIIGM